MYNDQEQRQNKVICPYVLTVTCEVLIKYFSFIFSFEIMNILVIIYKEDEGCSLH